MYRATGDAAKATFCLPWKYPDAARYCICNVFFGNDACPYERAFRPQPPQQHAVSKAL